MLNGDSSNLDLPEKCVDAVVTDPPYFDFVHYSELSDFFYAWLKPVIEKDYIFFDKHTSRRSGEVQNRSQKEFAANLSKVFKECNRVLKDDGLLIFSFHHSKSSGWACSLEAIRNANFYIDKAYPIKAEMSVSSPKNQAKSPINLDALIICKKISVENTALLNGYISETTSSYNMHLSVFKDSNRLLSTNDKRVIFYSQLISVLSKSESAIKTEQLSEIVNTLVFEEEVLNA